MKERTDIINALKALEHKRHNNLGYDAEEILAELNIPYNKENQKMIRRKLRLLILKEKYPEFKTAGNEDIVYCPSGKWSGKYRLSEYK